VDEDRAARHLIGAVHIETISHPSPDAREDAQFAKLQAYLKETFPSVRDRLGWEDLGGSILLTWKGSDAGLKPLLLLAHMDVVPATEEGADGPSAESDSWARLAFGSDLEATKPFIVGRGTLDDKVSVVGILEATEALVKEGFTPRRTLLLAFGRDEEVGGKRGAARIARTLSERGVRPECVLDEGSYVLEGLVPGVSRPVAPIGVAEKGYVDVELSVQAPGGHSSLPPPQTAIGVLSAAVARLEGHPLPARLDGLTGETIRSLAPEVPFGPRVVLANTWLFGGVLERLLAASPPANALIRTTTAVTLVQGGTKDNVLPGSAAAIVNFRLLPGDTSKSVLNHVLRAVNDPRVSVRFADPAKYSEVFEASNVSPSDSDAYQTVRSTVLQTFPGAIVVPYLVSAGTDARHYEDLTDNVYRFLPLRLASEDLERIHGPDERIRRGDFTRAVRFYYRLIKNFQEAAGHKGP
jgi:carboxypeptidase PM20D1